jgi:hypothetical protein
MVLKKLQIVENQIFDEKKELQRYKLGRMKNHAAQYSDFKIVLASLIRQRLPSI